MRLFYERIPGNRSSVTEVTITPKVSAIPNPDDAYIKRHTVPFSFVPLAGGQVGLSD